MSGRDLDRRQFLAVGGGGLVLCALGGRTLNLKDPGDLERVNSELEVPPKVAAAKQAQLDGPPTTPREQTVLAAERATGTRREYWIKAEAVKWNAIPSGRDEMTDKKVKTKSRFTAWGYRAYTANFGQPITNKATIPGPVIQCRVGDTVVVNFQNTLSSPTTIHPHGIKYSVDMDGTYKGKYTDPGGFVQQGETFQYVWEAEEGTEGVWPYHDHGPMEPLPVYLGMFGTLIVRPKGAPVPDRENIVWFHSFQPTATGLPAPLYCINGKSYAGNTPTFKANVGDNVAWYVIAMDNDFHTFHIHGHRWRNAAGEIVDNQTVGPGDGMVASYVEDNPGRWLYHCHVFTHLAQGMTGWYEVE